MRRLCRQLPILLLLLPTALWAQRPLTPPILVSTPSQQVPFYPRVAASPDGDFVVAWLQVTSGQSFGYDLHARRFSAGGAPLTEDLLITGDAVFLGHAVAAMEDGSFAVSFLTSSGLRVRVYGPDGVLSGESVAAPYGQYPALAVRDDGAFLLVWDRSDALFARLFSSDGSPLGPQRQIASAHLVAPPQIAAGPDRGFVVTWSRARSNNRFTVLAQRLGPAGELQGKTITVRAEAANGASSPDVARDAAGDFLVIWSEYLGNGIWGTLGRRYSAAGARLGGLLTLERTTGDVPRLTMDPAGNFVVAWLEHGSPGKVRAQRFTAEGAPFRQAFQVDTPPPAATRDPDVASAANGDFIVVWGAGRDVYARLYRKR